MVPTLRELESVCQKPRWREIGSWLARRVARPVALCLTWLVVRWPITANAITSAALVIGGVAAVLLGAGQPSLFVAGALTLNLWYVLDHVDGQVARFHRSESVTGVYFDFMMHHLVHPAVAFALGYGVAVQTNQLAWTLAGAAFALAVSALSLGSDCRYKAFFAELKRCGEGRLQIENSKLQVPDCKLQIANCKLQIAELPVAETQQLSQASSAAAGFGSRVAGFFRAIHRTALRLLEMPNIVIAVTLLATTVFFSRSHGQRCVQVYVLAMSVLAPLLAVGRLAKQVWLRRPDAEFRAFVSDAAADLSAESHFDPPDRISA